ncbi:class A beta-lactamase [Serratia sp. NPDC087055]|uniref:class A beta-lactamase n=1 Tax=Serratia sp. NPDC087055 TaxID=3364516 RepID=UPI003850A4D5
MRVFLQSVASVVVFSSFIPLSFSATLDDEVNKLSKEGWSIGLSILNMDGKMVSINGDERFPLDSTVKALACANILAKVDENKINLDDSILVKPENIVEYSPIVKNYINKKITLQQSCEATTSYSDNTAANIVISAGGGPEGLTSFMRSIGDDITRSDRYEPELTVNPDHDLRDTTTPNAINSSLKRLLTGKVLSDSSKVQLKNWMMGNKVADDMLRATLPQGWEIADRSGASDYGVRGLISMVWSEKSSPIFISIYVKKNGTSLEERSSVINSLSKYVVMEYLPK